MSLTTSTMIVNMQIRTWLGHRLDKEQSRRVTEQAGADSDVARVNKHLIPKEKLAPITQAVSACRTHFYTHTLPWKDNGDRLLTRKAFTSFIEEHRKLKGDFDAAVEHFLTHDYLIARDQAAFRMGDLFNSNDYPRADQLRNKFDLRLDIDSVTEAGDFRVKLERDHMVEVKSAMQEAMSERVAKAVQDMWARISETLGHYAARMAEDEPTFRAGTVSNLEELVDILPNLNFLDDPMIDKVIEDIRKSLIGHSAKELRENDDLRAQAAQEASRILEDMSGFMQAFGKAA